MTGLREFAIVLTAAMTTVVQAPPAHADETMTITGAWARPDLGGSNMSVLYMSLNNSGSQADVLVSVASPDAESTQLHVSAVENGMVNMQPLAEVALPPGQTVLFRPKGMHVMLKGLKHPLKAGDHIAATLTFKTHAPVTVDAIVSMTPPSGPN